jgi:hypothetical protein
MTARRAGMRGRPSACARGASRAVMLTSLAAAFVICFLVFAGAPPRAHAADGPAPYEDYRSRIAEARTVLEEATPSITDETVARKMAADIARLLPATEAVDAGDLTVLVDNSVLRTYTLELDVAVKEGTRTELGTQIGAYLTSLDAANPPLSGTLRSDPAALKALLAEGVSPARKSLGDYLTEWLAKFADALRQWLVDNLGAKGASTAVTTTLVVVVCALAALVAVLLVRAILRGRRALAARDAAALDMASPVVAAAEGLPADIVAHADSLAGQGLFRDAVRALFGGAARELVDRGLLRRTRTRTDAELLADVAPVAPGVSRPLRELTSAFEVAWYGHIDPSEDGFRVARGRYREVLAAATTATAAAAVAETTAAAAPETDTAGTPEAGGPR